MVQSNFFKRTGWRIFIRIFLLFITLTTVSFLLVHQWYVYLLLVLPIIAYQLAELYRFQHKAQTEL